MTRKRQLLVRKITYVAMCVAWMSICSWLTVPFVVNFTLQLFAVFLIAAISDWKLSLASIGSYLMLGLLGLPIFSGFQGGPSVFANVTGGFLIGFVAATAVIGGAVRIWGRKTIVLVASMAVGLMLCYAFGTAWYIWVFAYRGNSVSVWFALSYCVFPFLLPDCLKIYLAVLLSNRLSTHLRRMEL